MTGAEVAPGTTDSGGPPGRSATVFDQIARTLVLPVLRLRDHTRTLDVGAALASAGLGVMEVTLDHADGVASIARMVGTFGRDVLVGAGTVTDPAEVPAVVDAGSSFIVTPHLDPAVVEAALRHDLLVLPGVLTPTELGAAVRLGLQTVKLFPAGPVGVGYLRAMVAPYRGVAVVPTGGIALDDVPAWLGAGAAAVGLGASLASDSMSPEEVHQRATHVVKMTAAFRAQPNLMHV